MKTEENLSGMIEEVVKLVQSSKDISILAEVRAILNGETGDWWDELTEEEKAGIEEADADVAAGRVFTTEEVMRDARPWLRK